MKKALVMFTLMLGMLFTAQAQYSNELIKVGQQAPELEFPTPEGKVMKLSAMMKGKYVILDFWASWCGPCRMANPGLVKMYNEFSAKQYKDAKGGFTVVSVSLDKDKEAWKAAIAKDGLIWKNHMSDLGGWQSKATEKYGLSYIPQCFLVGPKGEILGKYNRAEEAIEELNKHVK